MDHKEAEQFYTGSGFSPLPAKFLGKVRSISVPPDSKRKKNTHASCWHIDLENDIRSIKASSQTRAGSSLHIMNSVTILFQGLHAS